MDFKGLLFSDVYVFVYRKIDLAGLLFITIRIQNTFCLSDIYCG